MFLLRTFRLISVLLTDKITSAMNSQAVENETVLPLRSKV